MKNFKKWLKTNKTAVFGAILFAVFFFSGLFTIGTLKSPNSAFKVSQQFVEEPVTAVISLSGTDTLKDIYIHTGAVYTKPGVSARITARYSSSIDSTGSTIGTYEIKNSGSVNSKLYNWQPLVEGRSISVSQYKYIHLTFTNDMNVNEIVFLNTKGGVIKAETVRENGAPLAEGKHSALTDEQDSFNLSSSYRNTVTEKESYLLSASENLKAGMGYVTDGYANAPGVLLVTVGTAIFGVNTFGLRIIPFLFNAATVLLAFFFGQKLIKNKFLAFLVPVLFALGGLPFSVGRFGSVIPIYSFFSLLSIYFMHLFFTVAAVKKPVSYTVKYLILSGAAFTLSLAVSTFALFTLPVVIALFAAGFIRQNKRYAKVTEKNKSDSAAVKELNLSLAYKKKADFLIAAASFILLPIIFLTLIYIPFYAWLNNAYSAGGYFGAIKADLFKVFSFSYGANYEAVSASKFYAWFINYRPAVLYSNAAAAGKQFMTTSYNLVLAALALFSTIGASIFMLTYIFSKKVTQTDYDAFSSTSKEFLCIITGLVFTTVTFMFVKNTDSSMFYLASFFYAAALLSELDRKAVAEPEKKYLPRLGGAGSYHIYAFIYLGLIIINFVLLLPSYFAVPVSISYAAAFYWLVSLKTNAFIK